ncbi:hypothetical protein K504DRAFT_536572 [Pleomassaria siparia CBS 279.74]|uniref:Uncharacterized protein n=1 Tax=Pleomassaria siparia CBS 279.74 TaxID=1314801 RepID=A0A6G1K1G3_9PLEO|nr:hypothetical protein K504DRAFT_536572 [Pleomassaria siparia CBS 279.74]
MVPLTSMRAAGLFNISAFLGLYILGAQGEPVCYSDYPLEGWSTAGQAQISDAITGSISDICRKSVEGMNGSNFTLSAEGVVFTTLRGLGIPDVDVCRTAFAEIVLECLGSQNVAGGEVKSKDGVLYEVVHSSVEYLQDHNNRFEGASLDIQALESRKAKRSTLKTNKSKPSVKAKKTKTKPKVKSKGKTKAKMPKTNGKSKGKAKTPPSKGTKTSKSAKAGSTMTCKEIYALGLKESLASQRVATIDRSKRDGFVGSRAYIEKRSNTKSVIACRKPTKEQLAEHPKLKKDSEVIFKALNYPGKKEMPKTARYYGFTEPETCDVYSFKAAGNTPAITDPRAYHVEHILEWQTVGDFFTWIRDKKKFDEEFDNPDPSGAPLKIELLPVLENHMGSCIACRKIRIGKMWAYKNGEEKGIFDEVKMTDKIKGKQRVRQKKPAPKYINEAKEALAILRSLLGARIYMRNPKIAALFKKQKERIGDVLDKLDQEMAKHPGKLSAWQPQDLKALWDEYMDERFDYANRRTNGDMDKYLKMLTQEWGTVKELQQEVAKAQKAWDNEKRMKWVKPW